MNYIALFVLTFSTVAFSSDYKIKEVLNNIGKYADVTCGYDNLFKKTPFIKTLPHVSINQGPQGSLVSYFEIDGRDAKIVISATSRGDADINLVYDGISMPGTSSYGHITWKKNVWYKKPLNAIQADLYQKLDLGSLKCYVLLNSDKSIKLTNAHTHINMHPHFGGFDPGAEAVPGAERLFRSSAKQYLFLGPSNHFNENSFLKGHMQNNTHAQRAESVLIKNANFNNIEFAAAPSGFIKFEIPRAHTKVTYSGGAHNYCVINNIKFMLDAFLQSENSSSLVIDFPMDSLVIQPKSELSSLSVRGSRNSSRLLKNVISNMSDNGYKYHKGYYDYILTDLIKYQKSSFASVDINYNANDGISFRETVSGYGSKRLSIEINYK